MPAKLIAVRKSTTEIFHAANRHFAAFWRSRYLSAGRQDVAARARLIEHKDRRIDGGCISVRYKCHGAVVEDQPSAGVIGSDYHMILGAPLVVYDHEPEPVRLDARLPQGEVLGKRIAFAVAIAEPQHIERRQPRTGRWPQ
jgi:hypothetical protein